MESRDRRSRQPEPDVQQRQNSVNIIARSETHDKRIDLDHIYILETSSLSNFFPLVPFCTFRPPPIPGAEYGSSSVSSHLVFFAFDFCPVVILCDRVDEILSRAEMRSDVPRPESGSGRWRVESDSDFRGEEGCAACFVSFIPCHYSNAAGNSRNWIKLPYNSIVWSEMSDICHLP